MEEHLQLRALWCDHFLHEMCAQVVIAEQISISHCLRIAQRRLQYLLVDLLSSFKAPIANIQGSRTSTLRHEEGSLLFIESDKLWTVKHRLEKEHVARICHV